MAPSLPPGAGGGVASLATTASLASLALACSLALPFPFTLAVPFPSSTSALPSVAPLVCAVALAFGLPAALVRLGLAVIAAARPLPAVPLALMSLHGWGISVPQLWRWDGWYTSRPLGLGLRMGWHTWRCCRRDTWLGNSLRHFRIAVGWWRGWMSLGFDIGRGRGSLLLLVFVLGPLFSPLVVPAWWGSTSSALDGLDVC